MITAVETHMEAGRETALRSWLERPEYQHLVIVAQSLAKRHLVKSAETALQTKQYSAKEDAAQSDLEKAIRYKDFLEVLEEIKQSREKFPVLTLK